MLTKKHQRDGIINISDIIINVTYKTFIYFKTRTNYVIIQVTATTLEGITKTDQQRVRYFKVLHDICTRGNVPYLKGYTIEDTEGRHFGAKSQPRPPQISAL